MSKTKQRLKEIISQLFAAGLSLLILFAIFETATRILYHHKLDYQIEMCRYAAHMKQPSDHSGLSHRHIPGTKAHLMGVDVRLNSKGFRDREYALKKPANTYRILMLGDSLTFGWGAKQDEIFPALLEERLNQFFASSGTEKKVEIINTGIGNYNTEQEVIFFRESGLAWKPDMVILNYFINDAEPTPRKRAPWFLKHSYFAMWLWGRLDTLKRLSGEAQHFEDYYRNLYEQDAPGWRATITSLNELGSLAQEHRINWVVTLLPELHAVGKKYLFQDVHDKIRKAAVMAGAKEVIDLTSEFEGEEPSTLWVSPDDAHPNEKAHRIIADGIFHSLKDYFAGGKS